MNRKVNSLVMNRYSVSKALGIRHGILSSLMTVLLVFLSGCTTTHYRESADKETYGIIQEKSTGVPNMNTEFSIEPLELSSLEGLPKAAQANESLGDAADEELGAYIVSLEKALDLAVKHSRTYQTEKESMYLSALRLTLERYQYAPIFGAGGGVTHRWFTTDRDIAGGKSGQGETGQSFDQDFQQLAGTPAALIQSYQGLVKQAKQGAPIEIIDERSISGQTSISVDKLLKGGGRLAIDLSSDFLRFLTGDPRVSTSSALVGSFTQPLLRGRGRKANAESLTQAERNVLYALRDFTRFRKEFTVDIATSYYNVLNNRDAVRNFYSSYRAFQESTTRDKAMVKWGQKGMSELGRTQQAELRAKNTWVNLTRRYLQSLDNFKIQLGLPVDTNIVLDEGELELLEEKGIRDWNISLEDATLVALHSRLDLYNDRDRLEDAARIVEVQANRLLPDLDLVLAGRVDSKPGDRFQELDFKRARWNAGINLDLPLNRKSERNAYRTAIIDVERADRQLELAVDRVKLDVRDALRNIYDAKQTYEINTFSLEFNERRVREAIINSEIGRGRSQDLVDAQNDLTSSLNDLTSALIDNTIANLEFWRDMGILLIKEDGQWEELSEAIEVPYAEELAEATSTD